MSSSADKLADPPPQSHDDANTTKLGTAESDRKSGLAQVLSVAQSQSTSPAPLRSDQVANAVAFLSNPKVVSSSAGSKRSFLQSKGLTDEEIDEAVKRIEGVAPPQAQPGGTLAVQPVTQAASDVRVQAGPQQPTYTWLQTVVGVAVMGSAAYGLGSIAYPHALRAWRWLTNSKNQDSESDDAQSKLIELLTKQVEQQEETNKEIKSVVATVKDIQANNNSETAELTPQVEAQIDALRQEVSKIATAMRSSAAVSSEMSDIKSILQQQVRAISPEISYRVPNSSLDTASSAARQFPDHFPAGAADRAAAAAPLFASASPPSASLFPAGAALSSERQQDSNGATSGFFTPDRGFGSSTSSHLQYGTVSESSEPAEPPHPKEFLSVLEMVNKGVTPNGVRTDILDKPPAPHLEPTPSSMPRKPKPWEQDGLMKSPALPGALNAVSSDQDFNLPDEGTATQETGSYPPQDPLAMNAPQESLANDDESLTGGDSPMSTASVKAFAIEKSSSQLLSDQGM